MPSLVGSAQATVELASGVPFISDTDLRKELASSELPPSAQNAVVDENASARLVGLRSALWLVALLTVIGLFFTGMLPRRALRAKSPPPTDV